MTFDQPLWLKEAMDIATAKGMAKIVLRLGGFHLLISACGNIYHMINGSRIAEALEEAYRQRTVSNMMSGKNPSGITFSDAALTTDLKLQKGTQTQELKEESETLSVVNINTVEVD